MHSAMSGRVDPSRDDQEMSKLVTAIARQMCVRYCRAGVLDWRRVEEHLEGIARGARCEASQELPRVTETAGRIAAPQEAAGESRKFPA